MMGVGRRRRYGVRHSNLHLRHRTATPAIGADRLNF